MYTCQMTLFCPLWYSASFRQSLNSHVWMWKYHLIESNWDGNKYFVVRLNVNFELIKEVAALVKRKNELMEVCTLAVIFTYSCHWNNNLFQGGSILHEVSINIKLHIFCLNELSFTPNIWFSVHNHTEARQSPLSQKLSYYPCLWWRLQQIKS